MYYYPFSTSFSEYTLLVSCNSEMIFSSFINVDLRAIMIGVRIKIATITPKENKEKNNNANDVLMFQNNNIILTSLVFWIVNTTINISVIIVNIN